MNITPMPVEAVARIMLGWGAKPEIVADTFRKQAATMREYADKAAASRNGKYRGFTADMAVALADEAERRAVSVPAAMARH